MHNKMIVLAEELGRLCGQIANSGGFDNVGMLLISKGNIMGVFGNPPGKHPMNKEEMVDLMECTEKYFAKVSKQIRDGELEPTRLNKNTAVIDNLDWLKDKQDGKDNP